MSLQRDDVCEPFYNAGAVGAPNRWDPAIVPTIRPPA
jgi:hypothetical protein